MARSVNVGSASNAIVLARASRPGAATRCAASLEGVGPGEPKPSLTNGTIRR